MIKILFVVFAVYYVHVVKSMTELEAKIEFTKFVMKCMKDHPVEMTELAALQQLIVPKKPEVKCLLACAYKLEGIINAAGLYDKDHAYKVAEIMKNGDDKRVENGKKLADVCSKEVNEAEVSDGDKDCERAGILFKCTVDNAPKFGFKLT